MEGRNMANKSKSPKSKKLAAGKKLEKKQPLSHGGPYS
jgi:hypothetical protein